MGEGGPAQTYIKKRQEPYYLERMEDEEFSSKFRTDLKNNFPQILKMVDCRSTNMFHGEHSSLQIKLPSAFRRLFTTVDIFQIKNCWF
ncbi:MAG: hypothetical protein BGO55_01130 [Sphingobacteriales bacterium 50-39]|nr:MAG: hypothetical protein BGO55_01130 [Sphingobacteriales bacterium 50-39]